MSKINKIGIITSGGDCPGMNATVAAIANAAIEHGLDAYFVVDGYRGLLNKQFIKATKENADNFFNLGGTSIGTARLPEFAQVEVRKVAVKNLNEEGIDALVIIGGDGSYKGAIRLNEMGIRVITMPGTIDNDIASSFYTLGFDSCLNTLTNYIDNCKDTSKSHNRCTIIETMGHGCGDLALLSAMATNADLVSTNQNQFTIAEIANFAKQAKQADKRIFSVIVSEQMYDLKELETTIQKVSGYDTRANRVGHHQRGGRPSNLDRIIGVMQGTKAVELLVQGHTGKALGYFFNEIKVFDIEEALDMKNDKDTHKRYINALKLMGCKVKE